MPQQGSGGAGPAARGAGRGDGGAGGRIVAAWPGRPPGALPWPPHPLTAGPDCDRLAARSCAAWEMGRAKAGLGARRGETKREAPRQPAGRPRRWFPLGCEVLDNLGGLGLICALLPGRQRGAPATSTPPR